MTSQKPSDSKADSVISESKSVDVESDGPSFGWNAYSETLNGRFAMVGFVSLLVLQLVTRQDFFSWLGLPR